jgi:Nuclease-related domain
MNLRHSPRSSNVSVLIICGILAYIGYTYKRDPKNSRRQFTSFAPTCCPSPANRVDQQGEAGERSVDTELRRILTRLCGTDFYLHPGAMLIEHAPGTAYPTAEIDHLPITPFGIFVVETKNWTGTISRGADSGSVVRTGSDGNAEQRRSPDAQNRTKVAFLRSMLPALWPVHGVGVFASPQCVVAPDLPISIVHITELEHWLRAKKAAFDADGRRAVDVRLACEGVQKVTRTDPAALSTHRAKLRSNP